MQFCSPSSHISCDKYCCCLGKSCICRQMEECWWRSFPKRCYFRRWILRTTNELQLNTFLMGICLIAVDSLQSCKDSQWSCDQALWWGLATRLCNKMRVWNKASYWGLVATRLSRVDAWQRRLLSNKAMWQGFATYWCNKRRILEHNFR